MDPNLFHLNWDRVLEVLAAIVVLSFVVERALSVLFESKFWVERLSGKGLKEWVAFIVAVIVCIIWDFDAVSMIFLKESVTVFGAIVTGAVIAGGSKGSLKLFRQVMGLRSIAEEKRLIKEGIIVTDKPRNRGGNKK